jgi:hypothetical protein
MHFKLRHFNPLERELAVCVSLRDFFFGSETRDAGRPALIRKRCAYYVLIGCMHSDLTF